MELSICLCKSEFHARTLFTYSKYNIILFFVKSKTAFYWPLFWNDIHIYIYIYILYVHYIYTYIYTSNIYNIYIYIYYTYTIYTYIYLSNIYNIYNIYIYICIYIHTNLPVNDIVRPPHNRSGDSQGQDPIYLYLSIYLSIYVIYIHIKLLTVKVISY